MNKFASFKSAKNEIGWNANIIEDGPKIDLSCPKIEQSNMFHTKLQFQNSDKNLCSHDYCSHLPKFAKKITQ